MGPPLNGRESLDSLGYRYRFWAVAQDHVLAIVLNNYPEFTTFLGRHTIEPEPFHVTMASVPSTDRPDLGLVSDRAYWVSGIVVRDSVTPRPPAVPGGPPDLPTGHVDVVSLGFGKSDAPSSVTRRPGTTADEVPYVEQERTWDEAVAAPRENRLIINAENVSSLTIDAAAARVDCNAKLDVTSDGPVNVHLLGCPGRDVRSAGSTPAIGDTSGSTTLPVTGGATPRLAVPLLAGALAAAKLRASIR